jgi:hypothetical protein
LTAAAAGLGNDIRVDKIQSNYRVAAWRFRARLDGLDEGVIPGRA